MYDTGKVLAGIVIFLALATYPFWGHLASGKGAQAPVIELPVDQKQCVETREYMRANHMDLLNQWRDKVVREGQRVVDTAAGRTEMSLTRTCMKCHTSKERFCDACHEFVGVGQPYCWNCHVAPRGEVVTR